MSAIHLIPPSVDLTDPRIRIDLRIIPEAEFAGWTVSFRNDNWANSADFRRGNVHVWDAARCWIRADLIDGRFQNHTRIIDLKEALGL